MKKLFSLIIAFSALSVFADPHYIPKTSDEQNTIAYMNEGQIAYIPNDDGTTARLLIGNGTIQPYAVMDPAVLRGRSTVKVSNSEIEVQMSSTISYADGIYYVKNTNPLPGQDPTYTGIIEGSITLTVDRKTISKVTFNTNGDDLAGRFAVDGRPKIEVEYNGSTAVLKWKQGPMEYGRLWNIEVYYAPDYMNYVNDTTEIDYYINDTMGSSFLSTWRQYCVDYWRTRHQLATNWAEHVANSAVKLNRNMIKWDTPNSTRYITRYEDSDETLATYGKGVNMITLVAKGGESTASGSLVITAVHVNTPESGKYSIEFSESITGFDIDKLDIAVTDYLESDRVNWIYERPISRSYDASSHTGTIVMNMNTHGGKSKFYKLEYEAIMSGIYQVIFRGQVIVYDELILRSTTGTTFWKINVNDTGVISTEQVTENMPSY